MLSHDKELCYCSENFVYSNVLNWFIIIWLWIYCTFIDNRFFTINADILKLAVHVVY